MTGQTHRREKSRIMGKLLAIAFASLTFAAIAVSRFLADHGSPRPAQLLASPSHLAGLLALHPTKLAEVPIARINLTCAEGLSGNHDPDVEQCLATLQAWVARVASETKRHSYRFQHNPQEFESSEGFFKMLMMAVVLAEDFQVHYDDQRRETPATARINDGFFSDPASVFLHGVLGPKRQGTCSSLPVLYVALGRQLGYPLKLVTTKGHLFVRWEGNGERFNIEATSHGLNRFEDDYYRRWPFEITAEEEKSEGYLKSLSPSEELGVFMSIRGMCLQDAGRFAEACESFASAVHLAPGVQSYKVVLADLQTKLPSNAASKKPKSGST